MDNTKEYKSGAKSSGNLPPYECLTLIFLRRCAERMKSGMHYGKHNWERGTEEKEFILDRLRHAQEHLIKAMRQIDRDEPMQDDDLSAVAVNCMFAMEYQTNVTFIHHITKLDEDISKGKHLWSNGSCTKCGLLFEFTNTTICDENLIQKGIKCGNSSNPSLND